MESVELVIHHGGNFVKDSELKYINGEVWEVDIDPDLLSYPHLVKFIKEGQYGKIQTLYYKALHETLDRVRVLWDDASVLDLTQLAIRFGSCDIYVDHGIDDAELIPLALLTGYDGNAEGKEADYDEGEEGNAKANEGNGGNEGEGNGGNEGEGNVGDEDSEGSDEGSDKGSDEASDEGDEGNEGDEDNDNSEFEHSGYSDFENDIGGVTQEDDAHINVDVQYEGENEGTVKGKGKEVKGKCKTTKAKGSAVNVEDCEQKKNEGDACSDDYYSDSTDPPTQESEKEGEVTQKPTPPSRKCKLPSYNPDCDFPELEEGMLFEDATQFKSAMIKYAVHFKRDIYFYKNESMRVRVKCVEGCPFLCHCSWEERYRCFQLKTCKLDHKCNYKYKLKLVSQKWLRDHIQTDLKTNLTISMVRRAQRAVLQRVNLGYSEQFKRIRDYAQECLDSNPGSTVIVDTTRVVPEAPCTFQRLYVCFQAMKRGFSDGCRHIIGLDGSFLKGVLKGELLAAVGRDANNQMYPIAWAVVEIENTDSWRWFLQLLVTDLGITNSWHWTIISDQQKGLVNVIQEMLPNVEHRNCARHIHANWSKKHRGKVLKKHFWMCANATTQEQFKDQVEKLGLKDAQAKEDLANYPAKFWCKAFMKTDVKCDSVDNNMCEAFNGTIVKARSKPIVKMLEDIRVATMTRIARCRKQVEKWPGNFGPRIMKKLNDNIVEGIGWHVDFNRDDGYEIKKGRQQFKVKLQGKTRSCRSWDLTGIPCPHACCAIFDLGKDPEEFIDACYSKEVYKKIYSHTIQPLNGELSWPRTNCEEIQAPLPRPMTGRPKKKRTREPNKPPVGKISRQGRVMTCSICKQKGHQKKVCPTKGGSASTSMPAAVSVSVTDSTTTPSAASTTIPSRRNKHRKKSGGFGVYINENTGAQILNPGGRGQQVLSFGRNASASAKKKK